MSEHVFPAEAGSVSSEDAALWRSVSAVTREVEALKRTLRDPGVLESRRRLAAAGLRKRLRRTDPARPGRGG